ncbi:type IV pilus twitching motility protein PilT [Hazenella coriacea]|uniref:Twitching motility protein PilT n=1 Tax=Hazenella coriacea TaxID=1179467 RepID=A0A4R3LBC4_9BACL|nr:PilT/PilU family type 4a pilus ATPase [Hazenella coriacea]TCS96510.1 twitching motility protein PilT [Hazenella coriacea]
MHKLLNCAIEKQASDLHAVTGEHPWLRVQGRLISLPDVCTYEEIFSLLRDIFTREELAQLEKGKELDRAIKLQERRIRVHTYLQKSKIALAIRLIPIKIPSSTELGLPPILLELVDQPHGLVLVTGPTGSGKTTTLASVIHWLNTNRSVRVITLEDPIEFVHVSKSSLITQREIGSDTAHFTQGIYTALRQDPDVIMIGELRDQEAIQAAIRAAEAGHLVVATLHTARALQGVQRLIDAFPAEQHAFIRSQLASILRGVCAQQLVYNERLDKQVGIFEMLVNTSGVAHLIRSDQVHQIESMMQSGNAQGMQTFEMAFLKEKNNRLCAETNGEFT